MKSLLAPVTPWPHCPTASIAEADQFFNQVACAVLFKDLVASSPVGSAGLALRHWSLFSVHVVCTFPVLTLQLNVDNILSVKCLLLALAVSVCTA